jgi:hypothetical protein
MAKARRDVVPPERDLWELGSVLELALKNPSVDDEGVLHFRRILDGRSEPVSRGSRCPRASNGLYSLHDLAELAAVVRAIATDLGGAPPSPARRRRR